MAPQETVEIVHVLEASGTEFHAAAEGLSDMQAKAVPTPGRWSVLECIEHIVVSEGRFTGLASNPAADPAPPVDKQKEAKLLMGVSSRATAVQAPEPVRPTGRFTTLSEALAQFDAVRANTIQFAKAHEDALYSLAARHPFFGACNGMEVMVLIAAHARRHAAQIREIRSTL